MAFIRYEVPVSKAEERMASRTLLQFRRSPVFRQVLGAFAEELQALLDAERDVMQLRQPADATGPELDVLGRLVGQFRDLVDFDFFAWFTPDVPFQGADQAPVWVVNAPLGESFQVGDVDYKGLVEGKVLRNHTGHGSVPEVQEAAFRMFGVHVSFELVAPMTLKMYVAAQTSENVLRYLARVVDLPEADRVYFLPLPATAQLSTVERLP